jgi:hypothetical protein
VKKTWVIVRVTKDVHDALNRVRASMEVADELRTIELVRDERGRVSLSQVIERLIAQREAHAARRTRSNSRRRKPAADSAEPTPPAAVPTIPPSADPPGDFS